jgi:hypothetical protein
MAAITKNRNEWEVWKHQWPKTMIYITLQRKLKIKQQKYSNKVK